MSELSILLEKMKDYWWGYASPRINLYMKHRLFNKTTFIIVATFIFFVVSVNYINKYVFGPHPSLDSKAAPNQMMVYKEQLMKGMLTKEYALARRDMLLYQIQQNPQSTFSSGLFLSEEELETLKDKNPSYINFMQKVGYLEEYVSDVRGIYMIQQTDTLKGVGLDTPMIEVDAHTKKNNVNSIYHVFTKEPNESFPSASDIFLSKALVIGNILYTEEIQPQKPFDNLFRL